MKSQMSLNWVTGGDKLGQWVKLKKYFVSSVEATIYAQVINFLVNWAITLSSQFLLS